MFDPSLTPLYINAFITAFAAPFPILLVVWITRQLIFR